MQRNRETKKDLKLKALSSLFGGKIQPRRLMVMNPRKGKNYFLGSCIFGISKLLVSDFRGQSLAEYLTMKRINPEFD
jgi:hypothetical protein